MSRMNQHNRYGPRAVVARDFPGRGTPFDSGVTCVAQGKKGPRDVPRNKRREDWQQPTDSGSGRPSRTTPGRLDDVETDDPAHPGRKPNPTGLQA